MRLRIFPKRKLTFRTKLSETEVLRRLEKHLLQVEAGELPAGTDAFVGEITGHTFFIHQRVGFRGNSFTPGIRGTVERDEKGTHIRMTMQISGCVRIFVLLWCYVPAMMLFLSLVFWIRDGDFSPEILIMAAPLLFMYWMVRSGFRDGNKTADAFLAATFEGEEA